MLSATEGPFPPRYPCPAWAGSLRSSCEDLLHGSDDAVLVGVELLLEHRRKRHVHVGCREPLNRLLQILKPLLADARRDFTRDTAQAVSVLYQHQPARFRERAQDGL